MLYVFHVDAGTMLTFDMRLALDTVAKLKQFIEEECKIPLDKQVLLVSGGNCLDSTARVCSFSAGTDTSPIFLFSKLVIEAKTPPSPSIDCGLDSRMINDLKEKVNSYQELPATINTVTLRTQLAQHFHDLARKQIRMCESLVHQQHLQQQGWAAAVANLEDITADFKKRVEIFQNMFKDFSNERETYLSFLQYFNEDLQTLAKIPVLPQLLENIKKETSEDIKEQSSNPEDDTNREIKSTTLLEWISATDNKNSMDQLFEHCAKGLEQFNDAVFSTLQGEIHRAITGTDKQDMKEIKGLGDRLFGLEQLMLEAKRIVQVQADLAQSFLQNQTRASNLGDPSILPDLCASHRKQLVVMMQNHQQLSDICRRCLLAKEELSSNLYHRLRWVTYVENTMSDTHHSLVVHYEKLKRLRQSLEILQQIHLAPATYLTAVAEVVRRRSFSQAFLSWASELACHLLTIHNEEVTRRKDFQSQFDGHFLNALFPGMDDLPPSYATQAPSIFDSSLPKLTIEDLEQLRHKLPEWNENLSLPDISAITNFFMLKSLVKAELDKTDDRGIEEKLVQVVTEVGLASNLDQNLLKPADSETCLAPHAIPLLKDLDKGCESETDTEEFEKVGQSPLELHFDKEIPSAHPRMQDTATLTEDNLETSRTEKDKLRSILMKMSSLACEALSQLKLELNELRSSLLLNQSIMGRQYESLSSSWENLLSEKDKKEKEIINKLSVNHELELHDCMKTAEVKEQEINQLRSNICRLEASLETASEEAANARNETEKLKEEKTKELQQLLSEIEKLKEEKEKSLKDTTERLNREHKAEIENIRSRFRLMSVTKMERSPSETFESLERDVKDPASQELLIQQIKDTCEQEKIKAVEQAVEQESSKWQEILDDKMNELTLEFQNDNQFLMDKIIKISKEKDKIINNLQEREANLNLECTKYKSTIQQLAESGVESQNMEWIERVEALEKEKSRLEMELCLEKSKRTDEGIQDMGTSVSVFEGKVDAATSPVAKYKEKLTRSQTSLIKSGKLNIESCAVGDTVLVLWDVPHHSYIILQESSYLYFLHTDSVEVLDLVPKSGEERKQYCIGEVADKEYCHALKDGNRYGVPKGTKFYRVKVKPLSAPKELPKLHGSSRRREQITPMSQSQTAEHSTPTVDLEASSSTLCLSLPSTPINLNKPEGDLGKSENITAKVSGSQQGEAKESEESKVLEESTAESSTSR